MRTYILFTPARIQLLIGMSTRRSAEPMGTAGMALKRVRGLRVSPPARITARTVRATLRLSNGARALEEEIRGSVSIGKIHNLSY